MLAADLRARLEEHGYTAALEGGRLKVRGPAAPRSELDREIVEHRDALKACLLLSDPPEWLRRLFELYASGHTTQVRRTDPQQKGGTRRYPVRVSLANIAAAVAAEIRMAHKDIADERGITDLVRGSILPEVEETLRRREGERK